MTASKDPSTSLKSSSKAQKSTTKGSSPAKKKKKYNQTIFLAWCKACGICIAFCPKKVFTPGEDGKPVVSNTDACIGCRFCELHCPDFAISILDRTEFRRRKGDV